MAGAVVADEEEGSGGEDRRGNVIFAARAGAQQKSHSLFQMLIFKKNLFMFHMILLNHELCRRHALAVCRMTSLLLTGWLSCWLADWIACCGWVVHIAAAPMTQPQTSRIAWSILCTHNMKRLRNFKHVMYDRVRSSISPTYTIRPHRFSTDIP